MKKIKLSLTAIAVLAAVTGTFATKANSSASTSANPTAEAWYAYNSGNTDSPGSYTEITGMLPDCSSGNTLCRISVTKDPATGLPDQSSLDAIQPEIAAGTPTTDVKFQSQ